MAYLKTYTGSAIGVMALMLCQPALAQEQASTTEDAAADEQPGGAAEIIVTAQRRNQNLQDVPVTVTVFNAEEIQRARILQIGDVVNRTVGLSFDAFPASQPRLSIRGITSNDRGAASEPSSGVFLDEIYIGRPPAIAFDAFDLERIEVLKGPQGTLFGRNVVGGAINVIARKPDIDSLEGAGEISIGNFERRDVAGYVNAPIANNTGAIRFSGAYRSRDGFTRNALLGQDVDDQETLSGRLQFYGEPTERFRFLFTVDGTKARGTGPGNRVLELDPNGAGPYTPNQDRRFTYGSTVGFQNTDTYGIRAELSYDLSIGTLTFLGSYRNLDYALGYDFDGGNPDPASPGFNEIDIYGENREQAELSSQELRLTSLSGSPVSWVLGVYHYYQEVDRSDLLALSGIAPITLNETYNQRSTLDSVAIFGDVTIPLTDSLSILGGVRYTRDNKAYDVDNLDSFVPLRGDEFFDTSASAKFDAVTWRGGFTYQISQDHMVYATVSRGFKSGGFQEIPATALEAVQPFNPEKATQYEIGHKSRFFGGDLIWNNTLFYLDYTDLQVKSLDPATGATNTQNAGEAEIKGFESQLNARLFGGFALAASYAYTDAKYTDFVTDGDDFTGNRLPKTARHKVSLSPSFETALTDTTSLTVALDYIYTSKIFDDDSNLEPETREPTNFVDARIIIDNIAGQFDVTIWGKNLTNEKTRTFQGTFLGANFGAFNEPRTYGVTLAAQF
ncbi:TonB-dependent receptor [Blastomonas sp.]|uniref:TonB-dependent receptor n=1 Tax=Blastomonas sp. TaxID=1909299 RepID=UPI00406A6D64